MKEYYTKSANDYRSLTVGRALPWGSAVKAIKQTSARCSVVEQQQDDQALRHQSEALPVGPQPSQQAAFLSFGDGLWVVTAPGR